MMWTYVFDFVLNVFLTKPLCLTHCLYLFAIVTASLKMWFLCATRDYHHFV